MVDELPRVRGWGLVGGIPRRLGSSLSATSAHVHPDLDTAMHRASGAVGIGCSGWAIVNVVNDWRASGPAIAILLVPFVLTSIWTAMRSWIAPRDPRPMRAMALACVLGGVVHPFLDLSLLAPAYSALVYPTSLASPLIAGAFGRVAGLVVAVATGVSMADVRLEVVGGYRAVLEGVVFTSTGVGCVLILTVLLDANRRVRDLVEDMWAQEAERVRRHELTVAQEWFDGQVHDKVLSTLLLAAQEPRAGTRASAADLAREGLALFARTPRRDPLTLANRLSSVAVRLGLEADIAVDGHIEDRHVASALADAATEALENVRRHAGTETVIVRARIDETSAVLHVRDTGRGFDVAAERAGRLGVERSIAARLRSVGGEARIASMLGRGTTVTLTVPLQRDPPATPQQQLRHVPIIVGVGIASVVASALIGMTYLDTTMLPRLSIATGPIIIGVLIWLWRIDSADTRWRWGMVVAVGLPTILTAGLTDPAPEDWRMWFVGSLDTIVFTIAFRFSARSGLLLAALIPVGMALAEWVSYGSVVLMPLTNSCSQLVVWAVLGPFLRSGFDRASRSIARTGAVVGRTRAAQVAESVRQDQLAAQLDQLGSSVESLLLTIASGAPSTPALRRECAVAEAAIRDRLVAGPILNPSVRAAVAAARGRGVRVEVVAVAPDPGPGLGVLRRVLVEVLDHACPGSQVRASWLGGHPLAATIVGESLIAIEPSSIAERFSGADATVSASVDEAVLIIDISATLLT